MIRRERLLGWWNTETVLVLMGILVRLVLYAHNRSLWRDQASLASNIVGRDLAGLSRPLDYNQAAPYGFLAIVKLVTAVAGDGEYALRFFPLVCGLASLTLFPWVARRLPSRTASLVAVGLFAVSPTLIIYATQFKQYSTDVLAAVVLLRLAVRVWEGDYRPGRLAAFGLAGAAAVGLANASVFVLAGLSVVLVLSAGSAGRAARVCAAGVPWLGAFAAVYLLHLREASDNTFLFDFWRESFVPRPPYRLGDLKWLPNRLIAFFDNPGGFGLDDISLAPLAAGVAAVGAGRLWVSNRRLLAALLAPWGMVFVAAALRKYPFGDRLVLFLVPSAVMLVAEGVAAVVGAARGCRPLLVLPFLVMAGPAATAVLYAASGAPKDDPRSAVRELVTRRQDGDTVYVFYLADPAFRYYTRRSPVPDGVVVGTSAAVGSTTSRTWTESGAGRGFGYCCPTPGVRCGRNCTPHFSSGSTPPAGGSTAELSDPRCWHFTT